MRYRPCSVWSATFATYTLGCSLWAIATWPAALIWRSLAGLLLLLVLCWPVLVRLLFMLAETPPVGPRGRAYAVWRVARALTTGHVLPSLVDALGTLILIGSVLFTALALVTVHPLLVPVAFAPLTLRNWLCAWLAQRLTRIA